MKNVEPFDNQYINHLKMFFYLVPVVGFFPALWTLYRKQGSREELAVCRQSITLAIAWLSAYFLLEVGAQSSEFFTLRLLFLNSLITSGYFVTSLWLMLRLSQGKHLRLPGISRLAERVGRRHLS